MFNHDKLNFEVEKFPLQILNESVDGTTFCEELSSDVGVGLRRMDTMEPLAIVSDNYVITQYMEIVEQIEEALQLSGLDLTDANFTTNVYDSGARMELIATFPAHTQDID